MGRARAARSRGPQVAATVALGVPLASLAAFAVLDHRIADLGRGDLRDPGGLIYLIAIVSATAVGTVLILRRPGNRAGWCFAALGGFMAVSALLSGYAALGAVADRGSLPGADVVAVLSDASFIPWLALVALGLHLSPTGRPLSPRWGVAAWVTVGGAVGWLGAKLLSSARLDRPFQDVTNPMAVSAGSSAVTVVLAVGSLVTALGLLLAGLSLLVRFRRSQGTERRQLHWLALAVIPLPLFVGLSFVGAGSGRPLLVVLSTSGFVALVPIAAGLSIAQYHLYDVDRVLGRATAYVLLTGLVVSAYLAAVLALDAVLHGLAPDDRSAVAATVAAVAAIGISAPARRRLQDALDRRFSRRRFEALTVVRDHGRDPAPGVTIESVIRRALGDPCLSVAYWIGPRGQWVTAEGRSAAAGSAATVVVARHEQPVARVAFDAGTGDADLVQSVAREALPELESTGLRAALALELVEVRDSRARIAAAQLQERQRIERDLHDGAQQRLLALAMQLRAALVNGDPGRLREAAQVGLEEAQATVLELRALANGLHPAVLTDGGLAAAIDDLATRLPGTLEVHVPERRFPAAVESTAWFIVCESVTNAMKHAAAERVRVDVELTDHRLLVRVSDDGTGGADADGHGLRGLADRAAATGGRLHVRSGTSGTTIEAELPCGS